jgi:hypothetical protein
MRYIWWSLTSSFVFWKKYLCDYKMFNFNGLLWEYGAILYITDSFLQCRYNQIRKDLKDKEIKRVEA